MKLMIDIDDITYEAIMEKDWKNEELKAIHDGTPIPENATNGDIIKTLFPQEGDFETDFDTDWWNAPYKRGDAE